MVLYADRSFKKKKIYLSQTSEWLFSESPSKCGSHVNFQYNLYNCPKKEFQIIDYLKR